MNIQEIKQHLNQLEDVNFILENGEQVPSHFHVTEVGVVTKKFIDCGGTLRNETVANFQLWNANDTEHRLKPKKLLNIIALSEKNLELGNFDIEVEYQQETIGRFGLTFNGNNFILTNKQTACLALDSCGIDEPKRKVKLAEISIPNNTQCTPGGGCC